VAGNPRALPSRAPAALLAPPGCGSKEKSRQSRRRDAGEKPEKMALPGNSALERQNAMEQSAVTDQDGARDDDKEK
jgi:hypothetical protein